MPSSRLLDRSTTVVRALGAPLYLAVSLTAGCGNTAPTPRAIPPLNESLVEAPALARPTEVLVAQPVAPAATANVRFLERPDGLRRFFASLADLEDGRRTSDVRVLQFGDSHTAADYQTGPLRRALQQRFGDGGRGFVSLGRPWKQYVQEGVSQSGMTGWSPERGHLAKGKFVGDGRYGLVGVSIAASRHGARAYTQLAALSSRIELEFLQEPHGGSADVIVDGARVQRIHTTAPEPKEGYFALDVTEGPHRVELEAVGDGTVRIFGLNLDRAKTGLTFDAFGVNGARVSDLLHSNESHFAAELHHQDPSLVVLAFGTNESSDDVPIDYYERQLVLVLGRVARAVPTASCLLLGPPDRAEKHRVVVPGPSPMSPGSVQTTWSTVPRLLEVIAMERKVAGAAGCAYYSELDAMGGPGSMAGWAMEDPPRAMLDRTHLSRQGYAEIGDAIAEDLVHAYELYRGAANRAPAESPSSLPRPPRLEPPPSVAAADVPLP